LQTSPYLNIEYLGILVDSTNKLVRNSPLRSQKIRQAIIMDLTGVKWVLYLRNSLGTPAESGFVPMGLPSFDSSVVKGYHYDPALQNNCLQKQVSPMAKVYRKLNYSRSLSMQTWPLIAKQLEEAGIPVQVEVVQKSLLLQMTSNSEAAFFVAAGSPIIRMRKIFIRLLFKEPRLLIIHAIRIPSSMHCLKRH